MLAMDVPRARVLFQAIPRPAPHRLSCADAMLDDFDDYYQFAARLVTSGFTAEERRREEPVLFVNSLLAQIVSTVQVGPVASVMMSGNFTTEQRKLLAGSLAAALQRLDGDDRAYVNSLMNTRAAVTQLAPDPAITASWRTYLVKHFTGARCQESRDEAWVQAIEKTALEDFNNKFANGASGVAPITPDEQKAGSVDGTAQLQKILDGEQMAQQRARFMALMFGTTKALTDYEKSTPEWKQQFSEYLSSVESMKADSGEPEAIFFMRKSGALKTILLASPSGPERDKVLTQYVSFLKSTNLQQESPVEWFYSVESFADLTRSLSFGEYKKMLDALENSGNPILVLYAKLDRGLPSRPDWAKPAV